jgi:hypothetical protein
LSLQGENHGPEFVAGVKRALDLIDWQVLLGDYWSGVPMNADEGGIEMKPDPEYTRKLLTAFEEAPEPTTDLEELQERGIDCKSKEFRFHMQLLEDDGFVRREDGEWGLGLDRSADGLYTWNVLPLRLTGSVVSDK